MTVLAVYCNKGGVGKTTTTVNLSYLNAQQGKNTLVVDLDPQGASSFYFRVKRKIKKKARYLKTANKSLSASIKATDYENLDLLPADQTHRQLATVFNDLRTPRHHLSALLAPFRDEYDTVIIDSPPTINLLAENIFFAADHLLVPVIPTTLSYETHVQLFKFFADKKLDASKILTFISMIDRRKGMHKEMEKVLAEQFPGVLPVAIPYSSVIEKMGYHRKPIAEYARSSRPAKLYRQLWDAIQTVDSA